jgi:hypothetical protein
MAPKEKGRPAGGDLIPKIVRQDIFEISITAEQLQSRRISRLYAVSVALACTIAELAFAGCPR